MKILIIGSKGFIGSHAVNYFSQKPDVECWGCDVVTDYTDKRYILIDSTNSDFNAAFEKIDFDFCINCSGAASVPDSLVNPLRDFSLNTYNVGRILEAIRRHRPECRLINLSSAAVYGNPLSIPVSENAPCSPVSPYGLHKQMAESLCSEYAVFFGVKVCSLRIFSAYGPGLKKQLLWDIYQKSKAGVVNLSGTGQETRDFIFVDDIIRCLDIVLEKGDFNASVYNIANGEEVSISRLANLLAKELGFSGELVFSGVNRAGDPLKWRADISRISSLGYTQATSITSGVAKYVSWIKSIAVNEVR
ncbi:NAD-dependent epimerase/dehydratase family protein [Terrimonas sp. NA20]|uniref:NAD-dependent epimerase/dehydratase family protein n=1 Tax=Terrimonas ginsenosidimutans TaxID=2908004 RepID=A0ABS9KNW4_9BACT|nr:NAD-dependent epimerase/dehydratase family protein [Terrimonas ginsenosidimutans]MCG2613979.1 NAD-dependent epimerase/dehydratase family protein [Terrimonas ginsenosidimutans]